MVRHGKSRQEKRIYQLLLDMRLMQEPLPSLLDMISRELRRQTSTEGADFLRKVQDFVFQVDFPSQYSALFVRFLEQNAYLMQNEHDWELLNIRKSLHRYPPGCANEALPETPIGSEDDV